MPQHTVKQGECLSSIAALHGLRWQSIWNDPNNAQFKAKRKDPNVLYPGDVLFVPEKRPKTEDKSTDAKHTFVVEGSKTYLRLRILDWDKPRANEQYELVVDGVGKPGQTDGSGYLEVEIPAAAAQAKLYVGKIREEIDIAIGALDPILEVSGKQARLNNLGYPCPVDGNVEDETRYAIWLFQTEMDLPITRVFDDATRDKIQKLHER